MRSPPLATGNTTAGAPQTEEAENVEPYVPSKPKEGSFFSSLTRRLSSGASQANVPRVQGHGVVCPRKVLNVDPNRERCLVPELDQNKLRRVSFCVDVEIAGGPRYRDEVEDETDKKKKTKDRKLKERAEGEALKNPETITEEKDKEGEVKIETQGEPIPVPGKEEDEKDADLDDDLGATPPVGSLEEGPHGMTRKKEKKKRSEAERKERKEKKLRRAQESGAIPVEMTLDEFDETSVNASLASTPPNGTPVTQPAPSPAKQDRPTTDPVRIYRRCCQLRETPILKRITEQLMSPTCTSMTEPGVVRCLDLTGSRLQLADVVTLGDWLAVVPVKRLILEDADLNDEGVRVILAGLLAAKRPEPTRRKNNSPKHRSGLAPSASHQERSGVIEKITFKNNPRITRTGWKHLNLFVYMCRSVKAIDLSMNQFPETLPPSAQTTPVKAPEKTAAGKGKDTDTAETIYKCLSERLGGSRLEELSLSECGLSSQQVRKVVDGAIMCGVSRLGLAGNNLSDDALEHVLHYLRSGVCHGLDLGGNDLRGKLEPFAQAFVNKPELPIWGLSLAGCNLDTASVRSLFPALTKLSNFRFVDLSHNRDLCGEDNGTISLLRRYIGQMQDLKRIHLSDVGMSAKQAIALAEVLPEGPKLAHLSVLENPQLTALANATDEAGQEEACALYASLMVAVRVSSTLICIDIDVSRRLNLKCEKHADVRAQVPSNDNNEIVKALAKQVVAYSLRNMEQSAIAEFTSHGDNANNATANAAATLTAPHGGEQGVKDLVIPDVIMHLVGHVDGSNQNSDNEEPAPDDDYIVGGTGVVKALHYVLGEKANDLRPSSVPSTPNSGTVTPRTRPGSSAGLEQEGKAKAKQMSKDLLESARKIRKRLQPALMKEATAGDEMAYRRLTSLDSTLQSMISRFEEEYPETRVPSANDTSLLSSSTEKAPSMTSSISGTVDITSPVDAEASDAEDEDALRPPMSRHNSDASLASRALTLEEGRLHRLGQHMRREVVASNPASNPASPTLKPADLAPDQRLAILKERLESTPGSELKQMVESAGWEEVLKKVGANYEDLRALQEQDPEGWEQFKLSQERARLNVGR